MNITKQKRAQVLERFGGKCAYCGIDLIIGTPEMRTGPNILTLDHLIPQNYDGGNDYENLFPACQPCNTRKGDSIDLDYFRQLLGLIELKRQGEIRIDISLPMVLYFVKNHDAKIEIPYVEFWFEQYQKNQAHA